jgi:hypothetical protein
MRTYGRIADGMGGKIWVVVETDADGANDLVYVTALCQVLLLNLNESPFYATYGIPAHQSIIQQVFPDYYVALTQQVFAQFFANLIVSKVPNTSTPTYEISVTTNQGVSLNVSVPIPV